MPKLIINIYTVYPETVKDDKDSVFFALIKREIEIDTKTVTEVFKDSKIIAIPFHAEIKYKVPEINKIVGDQLRDITAKEFDECHIVINTHGSARCSDISDLIIKNTIQKVSNLSIIVSQISALQCNGLHTNMLRDKSSQSAKVIPTSSMSILQEKLNSLKTKIKQSFSIRGFKTEYNPEKDKDSVINLLLGKSEDHLLVVTKEEEKDNINTILEAINICRLKSTPLTPEYEKATLLLSQVSKKITGNIEEYLCNIGVLKSESLSLYEAVIKYGGLSKKPTVKSFGTAYTAWKKAFKINSNERLATLTTYCTALSAENVVPKASCAHDCEDPSVSSVRIIKTDKFIELPKIPETDELDEYYPSLADGLINCQIKLEDSARQLLGNLSHRFFSGFARKIPEDLTPSAPYGPYAVLSKKYF